MDPDASVALAVAAFTDLSPDEILTLSIDRPELQTYHRRLRISGYKVEVLDALATLCSRKKDEVVAVGLKMGKPIELILATNDGHPSDTKTNRLTTIWSMLKKISDKSFIFKMSKASEPQVPAEIAFNKKELNKAYHEFTLEAYKYSYEKLKAKHAKWWPIFEVFRTQSLEWEQKRKDEGSKEDDDQADMPMPYQAVFGNISKFRQYTIALYSSLSKCCQTEKVGLMEMQILDTASQKAIISANKILDDSSACEYLAAKVALDGEPPFPNSSDPSNDEIGPVLQLRRVVEKLVLFNCKVMTLAQFAALLRMRSLFFSTAIKVTPVEKNRPSLLKWPSNKAEWMNLLSTIYIKQGFERETGQTAINSERDLVEKAAEYERAETVDCECAVLAHLNSHNSSPAFFYIGVSKRPSKPSCIWMKAFNDTANTIFHTRNTDHKWHKGWASPGLGQGQFQENFDARFQEMMESELCIGRMDLGLARSSYGFESSDYGEYVVQKGYTNNF